MSCNGRKSGQSGNAISIIVTCALILIICVLIIMLVNKRGSADPTLSGTSGGTPASGSGQTPINNNYTISPDTEGGKVTPDADTPHNGTPYTGTPDAGTPAPATQSSVPSTDTTPTAAPATSQMPGGYDYSKPVPESAPVSKESFSDAIFIGDSRMEDFGLYTGLAGKSKFYTHVGLSANQLISDDESKLTKFRINGEELTLSQALRKYNNFSRVYIMLGYNELGWPSADNFVKYYIKVINMIKEANPSAKIYVECVIPVARKISGSGVDPTTENNENIASFNRAIMKMCEENKLYYLNVQEVLVDSEGYLPDGAATDGIHLIKDYCMTWLEYLRNHVV